MSSDEGDRIAELEARVEELEAQDSLTSGTVPISRRGLLQGGAALGIGALGGSMLGGGNSGRVAAQTAAGQVGTDSDRVDVFGNLVDAVSVNADDLSISGPIATLSNYSGVQAAVDDVGGGTLIINETVTESNITLSDDHNGLTVYQPDSSHYINQPTDSAGESIWLTDQSVSEIRDVTFIGVTCKNDSLTQSDIENNETLGPGSGRTATHGAWELNRADGGGPTLLDWSFIDCRAELLNGYGILPRGHSRNLTIRGFRGRDLGFDGVIITNTDATTPTTAKVIDCDVRRTGRHCYTVGGDEDIRVRFEGIYGESPYICGLDFEPNETVDSTVHIDGTFVDTTTQATDGSIQAGVHQKENCGTLTGDITVIDPNVYGVLLKDELDLTLTIKQSKSQNPANVPEILTEGNASGKLTAAVYGGGSDRAAVRFNQGDLNTDLYVKDAYASSARLTNGPGSALNLVSANPVQGGSSIDGEYNAHLTVDNGTTDCVITIRATDEDGNAEYGIYSDGPGDDYNSYRGNVRNAYITSATSGIGSNSDTSGLIT